MHEEKLVSKDQEYSLQDLASKFIQEKKRIRAEKKPKKVQSKTKTQKKDA